MKTRSRILFILTAMLIICTMVLAGCTGGNSNSTNSAESGDSNTAAAVADSSTASESVAPTDKHGNYYQVPTDNDEEGWFSVEVLNQYNVSNFIQPDNTVVISKPQRDLLYLQGDENAFINVVNYAFAAIKPINRAVYLPVLSIGDDGVAKVTALDQISTFDTSELYPKGDETKVTFVYLSAHDLYECSISLEKLPDSDEEQICVALTDRTDLYKDLI